MSSLPLSSAASQEAGVWCPHVTVATVVPREGRFLLIEERVRGELVLNQPAGHLESGETLHDAAVRETLEETGWHVELTFLLGVQQWRSQSGTEFVRFTFAAEPLEHDAARPLDADIVRSLWLSREQIGAEAARLRSPMVLASIDTWLSGRRLPLDVVTYCGHP